ncbi:hypothetical protein KOW79_014889 [Hemibagrus wyckioides]|uniref:Single-pass membrane and coiled-coil domain-containing protein 4 n=1 Tax=Hemibagrus wyckioides TaxID=337641 RepID=A0A9D3NEM1_9TELE|nr:hypothetical protein KOW79_014889 [Hemibagrus wyckioides]
MRARASLFPAPRLFLAPPLRGARDETARLLPRNPDSRGSQLGLCNLSAALDDSACDKKERKQAMQEAREQVATVVLPTLAVLILLIVLFVYVATRPGAIQ